MKNIIIALLMVFTVHLSAQTIKGTVTDEENMPLWGVQVFIEELHKGTYTDEHGNYELTGLPLTTVKITVTYIGYEKQFQMVNVQSGENTVNFALRESVFKMDEVIISTALNKLQSENVMKVDRASIEMLKNNGAATLIDGMQSMAGVSQLATGMGIGTPVIRGL